MTLPRISVAEFFIPYQPVGYVRMTGADKWKPNARRYLEWRNHAALYARKAKVRLPLSATEAHPLFVEIEVYSQGRVHADPDNYLKAVNDLLFYGAKGGDKYVGGLVWPVLYDGEPGIKVSVRRWT